MNRRQTPEDMCKQKAKHEMEGGGEVHQAGRVKNVNVRE